MGCEYLNLLKRKNLRLRDYDYSQEGCYFVTTCTQKKKLLFGIIENGHMALNDYGQIAKTNIDNLSNLYCNIFIDKYVIMPNHIHLLILIEDGQPQGLSLQHHALQFHYLIS